MQDVLNKIAVLIGLALLLCLTIVSYENSKSQKLQQQASLLYKMQDDYFFKNENYPKILRLLEQNKPIMKTNGGDYSEYDLDDYLGFFELLSTYVDNDVLPYELVNNQFGFYITQAYKNQEITEYITKLRKESSLPNFLYNGFEKIAIQIVGDDNTYLTKMKK